MMARARMITNAICMDKAVNKLSDDTSRLAFTWLITFADKEGRTYGDPAVVRAMLFPRRSDITVEQIEGYIREWNKAGLIVWYEFNDDWYIWFPNFDKNQPGMRKEREPESVIPPPPSGNTPDEFRQPSGNPPAQIKGMEWNGKERNPPPPNVFDLYHNNIGEITQMISEALIADEKEYSADWVAMAIKEAVEHGARNLKYIEAILKNWKTNGIKAGESNRNNGKPKIVYKAHNDLTGMTLYRYSDGSEKEVPDA